MRQGRPGVLLRHAFGAALAAVCISCSPPSQRSPSPWAPPLDLRPGDVVFIVVPDRLWADMASRFSLRRYRHGHVGMVVGSGADLRIVHAAGNPVAAEAVVIAMPLATFAAEATRVTVFRPVDARLAVAAAAAAQDHVRRRTPFDTAFSLSTPNRVYCTELIWRVMSTAAGRDIMPVKSTPFGRSAVLLSDLELSPLLRPVASATREISGR